MFYCDTCGDGRDWPRTLAVSYGPCEICGQTGFCSDCPSSLLPMPAAGPQDKNSSKENASGHCGRCQTGDDRA